jgi:hypothetical protein
MMMNLRSGFTQSRLRLVLCLLVLAAATLALARIAVAVAMDEGDRVEARCEPPFLLLGEEFNWRNTTRVASRLVEHHVGNI